MTLNYQQLIENYLSEEERKSFVAAFNLMDVARTAPTQVVKAISLASSFYVLMIVLLFVFSASWILIIIAIAVGFLTTIALSFAGSIKFVSDSFLDNVSRVLIGLLQPIDKIYSYYQQSSTSNLSRREFTINFLRESFVPTIIDKMNSIPFKSKLQNRLQALVNYLETSTNKPAALKNEEVIVGKATNVQSTPKLNQDPDFFSNMGRSIEAGVDKIKTGYDKPFYMTMKIVGVCWLVIWILHLFIS